MSWKFRFLSFTAAAFVLLHLLSQPVQPNAASDETGLVNRVKRLEDQMAEFAIGTVIFTLNDQPPSPRWVPCEPGRSFPNENSVPEHLRGKPVPNLQNSLVAVDAAASVGSRVEGTLDKQSIEGAKFTLPAITTKKMYEGKGNTQRAEWNSGFVGVFQANENYKDVKNNTAHWACFGGQMNANPAVYEYHPENTPIKGIVHIQPPTHVYLRAYVRVQ